MPWFKVDDKFHMNPKVLLSGNAAVGLYVRLGSWCSDQLTDGRIRREVAALYGTRAEIRALVRERMVAETDDGYLIPDYLEYNPSRAKVLEERAKAAARQQTAREKAASQRESQRESQVQSRRDSQRSNGGSHGPPDPTRPISTCAPDKSANDELWNALSSAFGTVKGRSESNKRGGEVKELRELGANAGDVQVRVAEHKRRGTNWTLTARSLLTHWTELAPKGPVGPKVDTLTGVVMSPYAR